MAESEAERAERYARLDAEAPVVDLNQYEKIARRSVLTGGIGVAAGFLGWRWLQGRPVDNRIPDVLRKGHETNEALWRRLARDDKGAPTFDRSESSMMRVNGRHGLESDIDLDAWAMTFEGPDGTVLDTVNLDDVKSFEKIEMTVEHKCVEGWSHIVTWGGARFRDVAASAMDQLGDVPEFVYLETPDRDFYVGFDLPSILNQQSLFAYELQGEPLSIEHGAPVRLANPNKYGTKQLKRVGRVQFTNEQPEDYWYERGYDWYGQL